MAKHDRRKTSGQPPSSRPVTIQVPLPVLGVVNGVREAFHGFCIATGLQVLEAMMEADREVLCGAKGRHQVERPAWRGGSVDSQVTLGGRQVELPRLRVRSSDGEVPLASFQLLPSARNRQKLDSGRPQDVVVAGGIVKPTACACAHRRQGASLRSAPAPRG